MPIDPNISVIGVDVSFNNAIFTLGDVRARFDGTYDKIRETLYTLSDSEGEKRISYGYVPISTNTAFGSVPYRGDQILLFNQRLPGREPNATPNYRNESQDFWEEVPIGFTKGWSFQFKPKTLPYEFYTYQQEYNNELINVNTGVRELLIGGSIGGYVNLNTRVYNKPRIENLDDALNNFNNYPGFDEYVWKAAQDYSYYNDYFTMLIIPDYNDEDFWEATSRIQQVSRPANIADLSSFISSDISPIEVADQTTVFDSNNPLYESEIIYKMSQSARGAFPFTNNENPEGLGNLSFFNNFDAKEANIITYVPPLEFSSTAKPIRGDAVMLDEKGTDDLIFRQNISGGASIRNDIDLRRPSWALNTFGEDAVGYPYIETPRFIRYPDANLGAVGLSDFSGNPDSSIFYGKDKNGSLVELDDDINLVQTNSSEQALFLQNGFMRFPNLLIFHGSKANGFNGLESLTATDNEGNPIPSVKKIRNRAPNRIGQPVNSDGIVLDSDVTSLKDFMEPFEFRFIVDPGSVKSHEYNENSHESFTNNYDESLSSQGTGKLNDVDRQFPFYVYVVQKTKFGPNQAIQDESKNNTGHLRPYGTYKRFDNTTTDDSPSGIGSFEYRFFSSLKIVKNFKRNVSNKGIVNSSRDLRIVYDNERWELRDHDTTNPYISSDPRYNSQYVVRSVSKGFRIKDTEPYRFPFAQNANACVSIGVPTSFAWNGEIDKSAINAAGGSSTTFNISEAEYSTNATGANITFNITTDSNGKITTIDTISTTSSFKAQFGANARNSDHRFYVGEMLTLSTSGTNAPLNGVKIFVSSIEETDDLAPAGGKKFRDGWKGDMISGDVSLLDGADASTPVYGPAPQNTNNTELFLHTPGVTHLFQKTRNNIMNTEAEYQYADDPTTETNENGGSFTTDNQGRFELAIFQEFTGDGINFNQNDASTFRHFGWPSLQVNYRGGRANGTSSTHQMVIDLFHEFIDQGESFFGLSGGLGFSRDVGIELEGFPQTIGNENKYYLRLTAFMVDKNSRLTVKDSDGDPIQVTKVVELGTELDTSSNAPLVPHIVHEPNRLIFGGGIIPAPANHLGGHLPGCFKKIEIFKDGELINQYRGAIDESGVVRNLSVNPTVVNETTDPFVTFTFTSTRTGDEAGDVFPYTISSLQGNITPEDIGLRSLTGTFTLNQEKQAFLFLRIKDDFITEGEEKLLVSIDDTNLIASCTIQDTSRELNLNFTTIPESSTAIVEDKTGEVVLTSSPIGKSSFNFEVSGTPNNSDNVSSSSDKPSPIKFDSFKNDFSSIPADLNQNYVYENDRTFVAENGQYQIAKFTSEELDDYLAVILEDWGLPCLGFNLEGDNLDNIPDFRTVDSLIGMCPSGFHLRDDSGTKPIGLSYIHEPNQGYAKPSDSYPYYTRDWTYSTRIKKEDTSRFEVSSSIPINRIPTTRQLIDHVREMPIIPGQRVFEKVRDGVFRGLPTQTEYQLRYLHNPLTSNSNQFLTEHWNSCRTISDSTPAEWTTTKDNFLKEQFEIDENLKSYFKEPVTIQDLYKGFYGEDFELSNPETDQGWANQNLPKPHPWYFGDIFTDCTNLPWGENWTQYVADFIWQIELEEGRWVINVYQFIDHESKLKMSGYEIAPEDNSSFTASPLNRLNKNPITEDEVNSRRSLHDPLDGYIAKYTIYKDRLEQSLSEGAPVGVEWEFNFDAGQHPFFRTRRFANFINFDNLEKIGSTKLVRYNNTKHITPNRWHLTSIGFPQIPYYKGYIEDQIEHFRGADYSKGQVGGDLSKLSWIPYPIIYTAFGTEIKYTTNAIEQFQHTTSKTYHKPILNYTGLYHPDNVRISVSPIDKDFQTIDDRQIFEKTREQIYSGEDRRTFYPAGSEEAIARSGGSTVTSVTVVEKRKLVEDFVQREAPYSNLNPIGHYYPSAAIIGKWMTINTKNNPTSIEFRGSDTEIISTTDFTAFQVGYDSNFNNDATLSRKMFGDTIGQQFVSNSIFARAESTFNTRERLDFEGLTQLSESPSLGDSPSGFLNRRTNTLSLRIDTENIRDGENITFMIEAFSADSPIRRTARFTNDDIQFCSRYMDNSSVSLSGFGTNNSPNTYNQVSSLLNDGVFTNSEGLQYIDYGSLNGDYRYLGDFSPSQAISNVTANGPLFIHDSPTFVIPNDVEGQNTSISNNEFRICKSVDSPNKWVIQQLQKIITTKPIRNVSDNFRQIDIKVSRPDPLNGIPPKVTITAKGSTPFNNLNAGDKIFITNTGHDWSPSASTDTPRIPFGREDNPIVISRKTSDNVVECDGLLAFNPATLQKRSGRQVVGCTVTNVAGSVGTIKFKNYRAKIFGRKTGRYDDVRFTTDSSRFRDFTITLDTTAGLPDDLKNLKVGDRVVFGYTNPNLGDGNLTRWDISSSLTLTRTPLTQDLIIGENTEPGQPNYESGIGGETYPFKDGRWTFGVLSHTHNDKVNQSTGTNLSTHTITQVLGEGKFKIRVQNNNYIKIGNYNRKDHVQFYGTHDYRAHVGMFVFKASNFPSSQTTDQDPAPNRTVIDQREILPTTPDPSDPTTIPTALIPKGFARSRSAQGYQLNLLTLQLVSFELESFLYKEENELESSTNSSQTTIEYAWRIKSINFENGLQQATTPFIHFDSDQEIIRQPEIIPRVNVNGDVGSIFIQNQGIFKGTGNSGLTKPNITVTVYGGGQFDTTLLQNFVDSSIYYDSSKNYEENYIDGGVTKSYSTNLNDFKVFKSSGDVDPTGIFTTGSKQMTSKSYFTSSNFNNPFQNVTSLVGEDGDVISVSNKVVRLLESSNESPTLSGQSGDSEGVIGSDEFHGNRVTGGGPRDLSKVIWQLGSSLDDDEDIAANDFMDRSPNDIPAITTGIIRNNPLRNPNRFAGLNGLLGEFTNQLDSPNSKKGHDEILIEFANDRNIVEGNERIKVSILTYFSTLARRAQYIYRQIGNSVLERLYGSANYGISLNNAIDAIESKDFILVNNNRGFDELGAIIDLVLGTENERDVTVDGRVNCYERFSRSIEYQPRAGETDTLVPLFGILIRDGSGNNGFRNQEYWGDNLIEDNIITDIETSDRFEQVFLIIQGYFTEKLFPNHEFTYIKRNSQDKQLEKFKDNLIFNVGDTVDGKPIVGTDSPTPLDSFNSPFNISSKQNSPNGNKIFNSPGDVLEIPIKGASETVVKKYWPPRPEEGDSPQVTGNIVNFTPDPRPTNSVIYSVLYQLDVNDGQDTRFEIVNYSLIVNNTVNEIQANSFSSYMGSTDTFRGDESPADSADSVDDYFNPFDPNGTYYRIRNDQYMLYDNKGNRGNFELTQEGLTGTAGTASGESNWVIRRLNPRQTLFRTIDSFAWLSTEGSDIGNVPQGRLNWAPILPKDGAISFDSPSTLFYESQFNSPRYITLSGFDV